VLAALDRVFATLKFSFLIRAILRIEQERAIVALKKIK
jgi:hypothetical protein